MRSEIKSKRGAGCGSLWEPVDHTGSQRDSRESLTFLCVRGCVCVC